MLELFQIRKACVHGSITAPPEQTEDCNQGPVQVNFQDEDGVEHTLIAYYCGIEKEEDEKLEQEEIEENIADVWFEALKKFCMGHPDHQGPPRPGHGSPRHGPPHPGPPRPRQKLCAVEVEVNGQFQMSQMEDCGDDSTCQKVDF